MMIAPVGSIAQMNAELAALIGAAGLQLDCGCGGRVDAEVAIIAEAPGERELQQKAPLVGGSGKYLWDVLRKDGITRNNVYITNVVKRKLVNAADSLDIAPKDRKLTLGKQEMEQWRHILWEELSRLPNLKYIVALGGYALKSLVGEDGIMNYRGSVYPLKINGRPVDALFTYNPAFVMREAKQEIVFRMDIGKLRRMKNGTFKKPQVEAVINPTYAEAMDYIHFLYGVDEPIAYDIETMANETACVGFAHSNTDGMCIAFRSQSDHMYSLEEERVLRCELQSLFNDPTREWVTQNGHFDATWLWYKDRIHMPKHHFDTMLAHHLLYPSLPHNLGFICAQYTDHPYYKDDGKQWRQMNDVDTFWRYNVTDCCITRMAYEKMDQELGEQKLADFFYNHVMKLQPELVGMTVGGVLCDAPLKAKVALDLEAEVARAKDHCQETARAATGVGDYTYNPRSVRDLAKLFFTDLKLVGRGNSTDRENRDRMRSHPRTAAPAKAAIDAVNRYLGEAKFASTYANSRLDEDGRFRCEYKQTGVQSAPGRLSSSQTMWGTGLNMQNIPERAKDMFVADPGYELSYYDMSQIEARFVAVLADIPTWQHQFELARLQPGSYDAHCALASEMFKVPYEQVPAYDRTDAGEPTIRFVAKRCRHGLNYRMAPDRLATTTGLPIKEAEKAYRLYHYATPEINVWWDDLVLLVRRDRAITSCLGRRWLLLERFEEAALDSIVAFEPQSMNGDWTAAVIYKCHNDPQWPRDARIILNIHDANIAMHRPQDGERVRDIMRRYAEAPIRIQSVKDRLAGRDRYTDLIVPAEFGASTPDEHGVHRWSTIRKIKMQVAA